MAVFPPPVSSCRFVVGNTSAYEQKVIDNTESQMLESSAESEDIHLASELEHPHGRTFCLVLEM